MPGIAVTDAGDVIGNRYRLVTRIAVGGMGLVWEAWDELLLRRVAVKQLLTQPGLGDDEVALARNRVIREARITARLHHPNAVTLYDVVDQDGYPCLIMQFVPSVSLSNMLQEQGALPLPVVSRIGADVASALVAAHGVGIVHRDVKPGNVLLTDDGTATLTDFGISHAVGDITLTATGMVSGTPAFLAPEVARGAESGYPADVFSLGSTLYAALEGTPPFGSDRNPMAMLHRVASGRIDPPRRSGALTPLLLRMLAPTPADRPVILEVAQALAGRPIEVRTMRDVPPTAVISAHTTRDSRPQQKTREPHLLADPETSEPATLASPDSTGRHRPLGAVIAVTAVLVAAVTLLGFLLTRGNNPPSAAVASTTQVTQPAELSETARTVSATDTSPPGTVPAVAPPAVPVTSPQDSSPAGSTPPPTGDAATTPEPAAQTAVETQEVTLSPAVQAVETPEATPPSPAAADPAAADPAAAVADYYNLMPANTDEGWARLTSNFQTGIAQNRQYYESFWHGIDRVDITDIRGDPPDHAEATISYYFTDGRVSVERTSYHLVQDDGILKLDDSTVLSSRTG